MKLGINDLKKLTGAKLYVLIFQISSLLPLVYIFAVSGYAGLITKKSVTGILFKLGICSIPRTEALGLSFLYKAANNEVLLYFALLTAALIYGIICNKMLNAEYKTAKITRYVFIALIFADLVVRLLPFGFNSVFEFPFLIAGFIIRIACLVLVILDLIADKKSSTSTEKPE